jgi:hypothetical protein
LLLPVPFYSYYYKNKNKNPEAISQKVTKKLETTGSYATPERRKKKGVALAFLYLI